MSFFLKLVSVDFVEVRCFFLEDVRAPWFGMRRR